jgi:hypothetical protein
MYNLHVQDDFTTLTPVTCDVDPVLLGAEVNGGKAVLGLGIGVCLVLQEQVGHVDMALLGSQVQRGESGLEASINFFSFFLVGIMPLAFVFPPDQC